MQHACMYIATHNHDDIACSCVDTLPDYTIYNMINTVSAPIDQGRSAGYSRKDDLPQAQSYTSGQVYLSGQHKETQNIHLQPLRGIQRNQTPPSQRQDVQLHAHGRGHRSASGQGYHTTSQLPYAQSHNITPQYSELRREQQPPPDGRGQNTFLLSSQVPRAGKGRHACMVM